MSITGTYDRSCDLCGAQIEQSKGRPRRYCAECSPPGDTKTATKLWKRATDYEARRRALRRAGAML